MSEMGSSRPFRELFTTVVENEPRDNVMSLPNGA